MAFREGLLFFPSTDQFKFQHSFVFGGFCKNAAFGFFSVFSAQSQFSRSSESSDHNPEASYTAWKSAAVFSAAVDADVRKMQWSSLLEGEQCHITAMARRVTCIRAHASRSVAVGQKPFLLRTNPHLLTHLLFFSAYL